MASPLTKLQKRKREIQKQLKDLQKELDRLEKIESDLFAAVADMPSDDEEPSDETGGGSRVRTGPRPAQIIKAAKDILINSPHPMLRGELLKRLASDGIEIVGANPANTLGTTLSRSRAFINLKGFGYWLVDKPYGPASYSPEGRDEEVSQTDAEQPIMHH